MSELLLRLDGVHTHIEHYHILQGVDLAVPRGGLTMLLGRNGRRQDHDHAHDHGIMEELGRQSEF